jgi:hypothetical protein
MTPNSIVPIVRAGVLAREFCRHYPYAEVEAVFERSCYLRCGDIFVCVGEVSIGHGPLTLTADAQAARRWKSLGLHPGQPASISSQAIVIGAEVELTLDRCRLWCRPPWPAPLPHRALSHVGNAIARRMRLEAPVESLGGILCRRETAGRTPLARVALSRIARFADWLHGVMKLGADDGAAVADLIGLGPGLTPSGDDFLVGALALLDALDERRAHVALARAVAAGPRGSTSPLSECLLNAAAGGHIGADLCAAVSAVVTGDAESAIAAVRRIGHASGWDMMAGILTVLRVVVSHRHSGRATRAAPGEREPESSNYRALLQRC